MQYRIDKNKFLITIAGNYGNVVLCNYTPTVSQSAPTVGDLWPQYAGINKKWKSVPFYEIAPIPIPTTVTPKQARLALDDAGLLSTVETAIQNGPKAWQITWEYATEINRKDPMINALATLLNLTSTQIDNLFIEASKL